MVNLVYLALNANQNCQIIRFLGLKSFCVRALMAYMLFYAVIPGTTAQSFTTFRAIETCSDWRCVVSLVVTHPVDRIDRAVPWRLPLGDSGTLSSEYGFRIHPIVGTSKLHTGVDIAAPAGTPAYASGSGWARTARSPGLGLHVVVDHLNGFRSIYAHLSESNLRGERFVLQGECVGWVGATGLTTGPHLHWSVSFRGRSLDPLELRRVVLTNL